MKMIAGEEIEGIGIGEDLTPQIPPLAYSLLDSSLSSRCSSCFGPLPPHHHHLQFINYCSSSCSDSDSSIHHSSADHHLLLLLQSHPTTSNTPNTSDLRTALRLLHYFHHHHHHYSPHRLAGLLGNRQKFHETINDDDDYEIVSRIRNGARVMSLARRMRDGLLDVEEGGGDCEEEEMALFVVLTNGVEVHVDEQGPIGIAVYGSNFSWINHSCSPNACYRFTTVGSVDSGASRMRIVASGAHDTTTTTVTVLLITLVWWVCLGLVNEWLLKFLTFVGLVAVEGRRD